jgi:hypothetical protein
MNTWALLGIGCGDGFRSENEGRAVRVFPEGGIHSANPRTSPFGPS